MPENATWELSLICVLKPYQDIDFPCGVAADHYRCIAHQRESLDQATYSVERCERRRVRHFALDILRNPPVRPI